ncbi:MAG: nucleotidyltransferase domain-containing protein, partial [Candidatus Thermoplasmatota archaeon]|nr:nucleotidyltransferase domain-containing protein [Candidatus Thermoplasmatota archaeon]
MIPLGIILLLGTYQIDPNEKSIKRYPHGKLFIKIKEVFNMGRISRLQLAELYSNVVRAIYGDMIKDIILYGSVARNEDGDDSDVDILVVQENDRIDLQRNLSFLSYDIGSFYNEHL